MGHISAGGGGAGLRLKVVSRLDGEIPSYYCVEYSIDILIYPDYCADIQGSFFCFLIFGIFGQSHGGGVVTLVLDRVPRDGWDSCFNVGPGPA